MMPAMILHGLNLAPSMHTRDTTFRCSVRRQDMRPQLNRTSSPSLSKARLVAINNHNFGTTSLSTLKGTNIHYVGSPLQNWNDHVKIQISRTNLP